MYFYILGATNDKNILKLEIKRKKNGIKGPHPQYGGQICVKVSENKNNLSILRSYCIKLRDIQASNCKTICLEQRNVLSGE